MSDFDGIDVGETMEANEVRANVPRPPEYMSDISHFITSNMNMMGSGLPMTIGASIAGDRDERGALHWRLTLSVAVVVELRREWSHRTTPVIHEALPTNRPAMLNCWADSGIAGQGSVNQTTAENSPCWVHRLKAALPQPIAAGWRSGRGRNEQSQGTVKAARQ